MTVVYQRIQEMFSGYTVEASKPEATIQPLGTDPLIGGTAMNGEAMVVGYPPVAPRRSIASSEHDEHTQGRQVVSRHRRLIQHTRITSLFLGAEQLLKVGFDRV